jgi:uncharacterized membrane protein
MQFNTIIAELNEWLDALPPEFLFLLLLPFVVAAAGIAVLGKKVSALERYGVPVGIGAAVAALVATAT